MLGLTIPSLKGGSTLCSERPSQSIFLKNPCFYQGRGDIVIFTAVVDKMCVVCSVRCVVWGVRCVVCVHMCIYTLIGAASMGPLPNLFGGCLFSSYRKQNRNINIPPHNSFSFTSHNYSHTHLHYTTHIYIIHVGSNYLFKVRGLLFS